MNRIFKKVYPTQSGLWLSILLALMFAFCSAAGLNLRLSHSSDWLGNPFLFVIEFLVIAATFFCIETVLWNMLDNSNHKKHERFPIKHPKRCCLVVGLIIFICWLPLLFAGWPGFFNYDSGTAYLMQWGQIESGTLNAHHPVLHTLYLKYSIGLGQALFGTFNAGITFSVTIQAIVVASVLSVFIYVLIKQGMGRVGLCLCTAYYALDPIIGMFAFASTKDVMASSLLVAFCLMCWWMYKTASCEMKPKLIFWVSMLVAAVLVLVLRTNFIVAVALGSVVIFFLIPMGVRKNFAITIGLSFVVAFVWLVPCAQLMNVQKSPIGIWNALCVPEQQLMRVGVSDGVSEEDKDILKEAFPDIRYKQNLSDVGRASVMHSTLSSTGLIRLYFDMGFKYPGIYLDAFLLQTEDAWSRFAIIDCYTTAADGSSVFSWVTMKPGAHEELAPQLEAFYKPIAQHQGIESIPVIGLLVSIAFYLLVLALCFVRAVLVRSKEGLVFVATLVFASLTNLFGPCMLIRYFLYLVYALPLLLWLLVNMKSTSPETSRA